jgi:hypothetical protein
VLFDNVMFCVMTVHNERKHHIQWGLNRTMNLNFDADKNF